jgi:protoheme IX farnesyltransferase
MIGWAAVTGDVGWGAVALFAIIFFWTPPHFWALSLYRAGEYAVAGIPMLPVVAGARETKRQMLLYTARCCGRLTWRRGCSVLPGRCYASGRRRSEPRSSPPARSACGASRAMRRARPPAMFCFSLLYLFLIFTALLSTASAGAAGDRGEAPWATRETRARDRGRATAPCCRCCWRWSRCST